MKRNTVHILAATFALGVALASQAVADTFVPADPTQPGGIQVLQPAQSITNWNGSNVTITVTGLQAPYAIERLTPGASTWVTAGIVRIQHPNFSGALSLIGEEPGTLYRASMLGSTNWVGKWNTTSLNVSNAFVGATKCEGCHGDKVTEWSKTAHATAVDAILNPDGTFKPFRNETCLPCHTVGKGKPSGFVSKTTTPHLANVQCENCHGAANAHVNISGRTYHPVAMLDAKICGSCHTGSHHPTYDEWAGSGHAEMTEVFSASQQFTCGACHVDTARLALFKNLEQRQNGVTNLLNPALLEAGEATATCITCHDPHAETANPAQLRNPLRSTNYYTFTTASSTLTTYTTNSVKNNGVWTTTITTNSLFRGDVFAYQYNANVQVCAQCHNSRGARWDGRGYSWNTASNALVLAAAPTTTSFDRPPHHSPQYNYLIGNLQPDYLHTNAFGVSTNYGSSSGPSRHGVGISSTGIYNTNQCVTCHVPNYAVNSTTNVTGHSFTVDNKGCYLGGCHQSGVPDTEGYRLKTTNDIARLCALLDTWAVKYGPAVFGPTNASKYGVNGWQYGRYLGALASATNAGPSGSDVLKVPDAIKQARFNLYMMVHDGSLGVHNPRYTSFLLQDSEAKILSQFTNGAAFKANAAAVYTNANVVFTNMSTTTFATYEWDFGNGTAVTTTGAVTNQYATPGTYTVTLTVKDGSGTVIDTITRPNYISVINKALPSFTMSTNVGTSPLTVSFANTSQNGDYYRWTTKQGYPDANGVTNGLFGISYNAVTPPDVTYSNITTSPITYKVVLSAYDLLGSTSVTNTITVNPATP